MAALRESEPPAVRFGAPTRSARSRTLPDRPVPAGETSWESLCRCSELLRTAAVQRSDVSKRRKETSSSATTRSISRPSRKPPDPSLRLRFPTPKIRIPRREITSWISRGKPSRRLRSLAHGSGFPKGRRPARSRHAARSSRLRRKPRNGRFVLRARRIDAAGKR